MQIKITRRETGPAGTFGVLYRDGFGLFYTGELPRDAGQPDVQNEQCTDCIPAGTYRCELVESPKFKSVGGKGYLLTGVPGRTGILIHPGNWCGDKAKGLKSDVQGCILLGLGIGELCGQRAITDSRAAVKAFIEDMGGKGFELTIEWGA